MGRTGDSRRFAKRSSLPRRSPYSTRLPLSTPPRRSTPAFEHRFSRSYWRRRPKTPVIPPKRSSVAARGAARASCVGSRLTCFAANGTSCRPRLWRSAAEGAAAFLESCSATPERSWCTTRPVPPCSRFRPTTARGGRARSWSGLTDRPTPARRCGPQKSLPRPPASPSRSSPQPAAKRSSATPAWADRVQTWDPADPVGALVERSRTVDLVVVGSRGVHGMQTIGSVSERIAHQAHCTALIVHEPEASSADA